MKERRTKRKGTEERAYFSFLRSYAEQADALEGLDKLEFLEAIISAGLDNVKPTFTDGKVSAKLKAGLFAGVRPTIEKGWVKFNAGGAPQRDRNASTGEAEQKQRKSTGEAEQKQDKSETSGIKDKGKRIKDNRIKNNIINHQKEGAEDVEELPAPPANFSADSGEEKKGGDQLPTLADVEAFIDAEKIGDVVEAGDMLERVQHLNTPQAWRRYIVKVAEGRRSEAGTPAPAPEPYYQDLPADE